MIPRQIPLHEEGGWHQLESSYTKKVDGTNWSLLKQAKGGWHQPVLTTAKSTRNVGGTNRNPPTGADYRGEHAKGGWHQLKSADYRREDAEGGWHQLAMLRKVCGIKCQLLIGGWHQLELPIGGWHQLELPQLELPRPYCGFRPGNLGEM